MRDALKKAATPESILESLPFDAATTPLSWQNLNHSERTGVFRTAIGISPSAAGFAEKAIFEHMRSYFPGIVVALNHIYSGGRVGFLTARSCRQGAVPLLDAIREFLGHEIPRSAMYFVNDPALNQRISYHPEGCERKLQILLDLLNHSKLGRDGTPEPSTKRANVITFLDDEAPIIRHIRDFIATEILADFQRANGRMRFFTHRTVLRYLSFLQHKAESAGIAEPKFWRALIKRLGRSYGDNLSERLRFRHISQVSVEKEWRSLMKKLERPKPAGFNSRSHLLMLDIDGTLIELDGCEHIHDRQNPTGPPLLTITRQQLNMHPSKEYWFDQTVKFHPEIPRERLFVDYGDFERYERVNQSVEKGLKGNRMFKKPLK